MGGECVSAAKCEVYDPLSDEWQVGCFQAKNIFTLNFTRYWYLAQPNF